MKFPMNVKHAKLYWRLKFLVFIVKMKFWNCILNENNYGNYSYGIEAAAESYFGISAVDLDLGQSAFLAGIPQSPAIHDIFTNRDEMINRFTQVLVLMYDYNQERGCIEVSNAETPVCVDAINATKALQEIENYEFQSVEVVMKYPHWVNYIRTLLEEKIWCTNHL